MECSETTKETLSTEKSSRPSHLGTLSMSQHAVEYSKFAHGPCDLVGNARGIEGLGKALGLGKGLNAERLGRRRNRYNSRKVPQDLHTTSEIVALGSICVSTNPC